MRVSQGVLAVLARTMLCLVFLLTLGVELIPNFGHVAQWMAAEGIPYPKLVLLVEIALLLAGSLSVIVGYRARVGAFILLIFLAVTSYYFHNFWSGWTAAARQEQMMRFVQNISVMGAMLLVIIHGPGPMTLRSNG